VKTAQSNPNATLSRRPFLLGVFLITYSVLVFQIVQTRVLSVIAWYYLAFFAISVAMLGMTAGAVWVYLHRERFTPERLAAELSRYALWSALAMPASLLAQFSIMTSLVPSLSTLAAWSLLMGAMALPYVFAGVAVSLALTRSPFPVNQVYGVDMLGAALGCASVVLVLNLLDGPSAMIFSGAVAALAAACFAASGAGLAQPRRRAVWITAVLAAFALFNNAVPFGLKPIYVKDAVEHDLFSRYERWNSYSRIIASPPIQAFPYLWGPSPKMPKDYNVPEATLNIDGAAGTIMHHYDGSKASLDFLHYDLVNLGYNLPGIRKSAVIGVGGGRDLMSAYLYGVTDLTGVELNPIFVGLHTRHPFYSRFSGLTTIPNLKLHVDDARSWFASTPERFDLIQMSMIDTWAATGAGAFSLSENGLYTLEGWRAFLGRLNDGGVFTVSRWFNPKNIDETGRMIALAAGAIHDAGDADARSHIFVAHADNIATLVLAKDRFTPQQVKALEDEAERLGFPVVVAPDREPESPLLKAIVDARSIDEINRVAAGAFFDLSVPTDNRPFFFNQLRFSHIPEAVRAMAHGELGNGVIVGNTRASLTLLLILAISIVAVLLAIVLPLRHAARSAPRALIASGTCYFALIGLGFMFGEISLLQYFSVYLGHPIYSLGVCLFSLIFSTGLGALVCGRLPLDSRGAFAVWGVLVAAALLAAQHWLTGLFHATTAEALPVRIAISLAVVMPIGFLLGFAFPTGMRLVEAVDVEPTPWFWGINGATGVLASVLAVIVGMAGGINVTMSLAGLCYLALIPVALALLGQGARTGAAAA
jgi:hypothetical protein